jgi:integrase
MKKRKILSKEKIQQIVKQSKQTIPEIEQLGAMAEEQRREVRSRQQPRKRKVKQQLKSTDYLSVEQFAEVIHLVKSEADEVRAKSPYLCRAVVNEMLIILMAETGLRASEISNLKLKNLPSYHGKPVIEVECGKGQKSRTVGVSKWFATRLTGYVHRYLGSASPESWLFYSERGGPIKYASIYAKIKRIGIKSGIWLYRKDGRSKSPFFAS